MGNYILTHPLVRWPLALVLLGLTIIFFRALGQMTRRSFASDPILIGNFWTIAVMTVGALAGIAWLVSA